jgi:aspartate aminotransferase
LTIARQALHVRLPPTFSLIPKVNQNENAAMLAERATILTPSLTLSIDSKAKAMKAEGIDVCGFGAGEPDFDTPEHIKAAAQAAIETGFTKYTPSSGIPELRQAISEKFKADNGLDYKPSQIVVSNGAKHSCYNAILATCQPGDEVIIPSPYWLSYPEMVRLAGADPVFVQTREENNWKMTADEFEAAMTPRTKMVILNSPGNPTGSVYTAEEMQAIVEVASGEDILILSDEIYEKLVYDGVKHVSVASLSQEAYNLTITVNGFSKAYAMTGWRLGYLGAPESIAKAIDAIQSHSTSNPCSFAQKGALAALKGDQSAVEDMRAEFDLRRNYMIQRLSTVDRVSVVAPQGAFYVLVNISQLGLSSTNFAERLLSKHHVAVVPGVAFGNDGTVRFSYATLPRRHQEGSRSFRRVLPHAVRRASKSQVSLSLSPQGLRDDFCPDQAKAATRSGFFRARKSVRLISTLRIKSVALSVVRIRLRALSSGSSIGTDCIWILPAWKRRSMKPLAASSSNSSSSTRFCRLSHTAKVARGGKVRSLMASPSGESSSIPVIFLRRVRSIHPTASHARIPMKHQA